MDITQTTVPGAGVLHDCTTRDGQRFRILVDRSGQRQIFVYRQPGAEPMTGETGTGPVVTIVLDEDEADMMAAIVHSRPLPNRIAELERRVEEIASGITRQGRRR